MALEFGAQIAVEEKWSEELLDILCKQTNWEEEVADGRFIWPSWVEGQCWIQFINLLNAEVDCSRWNGFALQDPNVPIY